MLRGLQVGVLVALSVGCGGSTARETTADAGSGSTADAGAADASAGDAGPDASAAPADAAPPDAAAGCTGDPECGDGDACNGVETCASGECRAGTPVECDDGDACNGVETCDPGSGRCEAGTAIDCTDPFSCTIDRCVDGECVNQPSDPLCDDGLACNGAETCSAAEDCQPGQPLCESDRCVARTCDEQTDSCREASVVYAVRLTIAQAPPLIFDTDLACGQRSQAFTATCGNGAAVYGCFVDGQGRLRIEVAGTGPCTGGNGAFVTTGCSTLTPSPGIPGSCCF